MKSEQPLKKYKLMVDDVPAQIAILKTSKEFVPTYKISFPRIEQATRAVLDAIRERLITEMDIRPLEVSSTEQIIELKEKFVEKSRKLLRDELPHLTERDINILAGILTQKSLGLGSIEIMLQDTNLEEIVINNAREAIWVYHRELGWLKSNIGVDNEVEIYNYASSIGRRVGSQITHLNPLMDAYLPTGDRANATLFPISSKGNTLTIRKFARKPWTITDFIVANTLSSEVAAFLWLATQYEMNVIITGGTASGKTSMLNVITGFFPPNHRVISIEDTREIQLPDFLHWVPMTTRPPNAEGKGEITMLNLMINALRMRPDRVIMGEIRRSREAEVLFEAIHTGHSVYSTFHSNTAEETYRRLTNPPVNIPVSLLGSLQLIVVMHRDRRRERRRLLQVTELISGGAEEMRIELNQLFRWVPERDHIVRLENSYRVLEELKLYSGMSDRDIQLDLADKKTVLEWMIKNKINTVNGVGRIVSSYYRDPKRVLEGVKQRKTVKSLV